MYLRYWKLIHLQKAYEGGGHGKFGTTDRGHVLEKHLMTNKFHDLKGLKTKKENPFQDTENFVS